FVLNPREELRGFLEPSLPDAELGEPHDALDGEWSADGVHGADRGAELGLRLLPLAAPGEHDGVVRAAHREDLREPPARRRLSDAVGPLRGAIEVAYAVARVHQRTEDRRSHTGVRDLVAERDRRRLVEERHARFDLTRGDERETLHRARRHLRVDRATRSRDLDAAIGESNRAFAVV